MLFQTKNNTPDIYTTESRDFQLLSAIIDCIYNAEISNQLKMNYIDDIKTVDVKLLDLISEYLGFFTTQYYPENLLRSILINFPYIIKYKGSDEGIKTAIKSLQNAYTDLTYLSTVFDRKKKTIDINTDGVVINQLYVDELLKYVMPIGLIINQMRNIQTMNDVFIEASQSDNLVSINYHDDSYTDSYEYEYMLGTIRNTSELTNINDPLFNFYFSKVG